MIVHPPAELGRERVPLLIVDDAHPTPEDLRRVAAGLSFERNAGDSYPGVRAPPPDSYAPWLAALAEAAGLAARAAVLRTSFAIVLDSPEDLSPIQRIPHFDTPDPVVFAAIHYLCDPPHGGTGFYRHRRSGYERIDAARQPAWRQNLARDAREIGIPAPRYVNSDNALFERIGGAELRFNRVIFYPANCLHSGDIGQGRLSLSPMEGRLTITSLLRAGQ